MRTRLAWLLAGISAACAVADTFVVSAFQPLLSEATIAVHGWPLVNLAALGSAVMGALVVSRYPRHPIGWLLSVIGVTTSVSLLAESYSIWVVDEGGPGPGWAGDLAGWLAALLGGPVALSGLAVMFLLAPDGHFLSRRWRYVGAAAVLGLLLFVAGLASQSPSDVAGRGDPENVGRRRQHSHHGRCRGHRDRACSRPSAAWWSGCAARRARPGNSCAGSWSRRPHWRSGW